MFFPCARATVTHLIPTAGKLGCFQFSTIVNIHVQKTAFLNSFKIGGVVSGLEGLVTVKLFFREIFVSYNIRIIGRVDWAKEWFDLWLHD